MRSLKLLAACRQSIGAATHLEFAAHFGHFNHTGAGNTRNRKSCVWDTCGVSRQYKVSMEGKDALDWRTSDLDIVAAGILASSSGVNIAEVIGREREVA
jgi:hypothetical protein